MGAGSRILSGGSSVLMPYIWAAIIGSLILGGGYFAWDKYRDDKVLVNSGVSKQIQQDQQAVEEFRRRSDELHTKGLTDEEIDRILRARSGAR